MATHNYLFPPFIIQHSSFIDAPLAAGGTVISRMGRGLDILINFYYNVA
jgi:hypothetical protein